MDDEAKAGGAQAIKAELRHHHSRACTSALLVGTGAHREHSIDDALTSLDNLLVEVRKHAGRVVYRGLDASSFPSAKRNHDDPEASAVNYIFGLGLKSHVLLDRDKRRAVRGQSIDQDWKAWHVLTETYFGSGLPHADALSVVRSWYATEGVKPPLIASAYNSLLAALHRLDQVAYASAGPQSTQFLSFSTNCSVARSFAGTSSVPNGYIVIAAIPQAGEWDEQLGPSDDVCRLLAQMGVSGEANQHIHEAEVTVDYIVPPRRILAAIGTREHELDTLYLRDVDDGERLAIWKGDRDAGISAELERQKHLRDCAVGAVWVVDGKAAIMVTE